MSSLCSGIGMWCLCKISQAWSWCLQRRPQRESAREQLVGHLMQDVDLLPAAGGHSHWVTQGLAMSLSRQNNGLKWGKWATWKPSRLTNTQQGKGLESQRCQLLNQEGMMQGFTVTLKVTEPGVIFWWVSLGWAGVIFMSDQQLLFSAGTKLERESTEGTAATCTTPEDPSKASAAFNSLHLVQEALPTHCLAPLHAGVKFNPTFLLLLA